MKDKQGESLKRLMEFRTADYEALKTAGEGIPFGSRKQIPMVELIRAAMHHMAHLSPEKFKDAVHRYGVHLLNENLKGGAGHNKK